ncbi:MAG TPA: hypothetical protein VIV60_05530 [Polyangiaceae bacterium]
MFNIVGTASVEDSAELTLLQEPQQMLRHRGLAPHAAATRHLLMRQDSESSSMFFLRALRKARALVRQNGPIGRITYMLPSSRQELLESSELPKRWASTLAGLLSPNGTLVFVAPGWARVEVLDTIESIRTSLVGVSLIAKFEEGNSYPEPLAARPVWQHASL